RSHSIGYLQGMAKRLAASPSFYQYRRSALLNGIRFLTELSPVFCSSIWSRFSRKRRTKRWTVRAGNLHPKKRSICTTEKIDLYHRSQFLDSKKAPLAPPGSPCVVLVAGRLRCRLYISEFPGRDRMYCVSWEPPHHKYCTAW